MAVTIINPNLNGNVGTTATASSPTTGTYSGVNVSAALNSQFAIGDLIIASFGQERSDIHSAPAGWTALYNSDGTSTLLVADIRYKFLTTPDELDDVVTFFTSGATRRMVTGVVGLRGAGIPTIASNAGYTANGLSTFTVNHPSVNASAANGLLMSVAVLRSAQVPWETRDLTVASGWTKRIEASPKDPAAVNPFLFVATKPVTASGTQAGPTHTVSSGDSGYFASTLYIPEGTAPASLTATPNTAVIPGTKVTLAYNGTGTLTQTAGPTVTVTAGTTGTATYDAPYTNAGTTVTFSFGGATASVGVLKATDRLVLTGGASPIEVPLKRLFVVTTVENPGDGGPVVNRLTSYIEDARQYYPGGSKAAADLSHLPDADTWKPAYWLPGSNPAGWTPPPNPDGSTPLVFRGMRLRGGTTSVLDYTGGTNCLRVMCPFQFGNSNFGAARLEADLLHGVIIQGFHYKNDGWQGRTDWSIYKTIADAQAHANPITPIRPGQFYYDQNTVLGLTGDAGTIDYQVATGRRMHENSILLRPGSGTSGVKAFYAMEAPYFEGDWVTEGPNINGIGPNDTMISGIRQDRVSVYFRWDGSDWGNKWPGGDFKQWYGQINKAGVFGATGLTQYQSDFFQHSSRQSIILHEINSRPPELDLKDASGNIIEKNYYGFTSGYQIDFGSTRDSWVNYDIRNAYVWRGGAGTVDPNLFPEIKNQLVDDYVTKDDGIGTAYANNPLSF